MKELEIKNLSYSYDDQTAAVKDVSLKVPVGSYVSIVGQNGSGKSTLAKLIIGLLEAQKGSIQIDDLTLTADNVYDIREKIAIVFQNPDNQFIGSTVRDDIAFGLENRSVDPKKMDAIIEHYAKRVDMLEYLSHEPSKLSGGQKQRVAIAGALAMEPEILILDEATSMLDPKGRQDVNMLVHELHERQDMTILSITHDVEEIMISDVVIVMHEGQIVMSGTPEAILKDPQKLRSYALDVPFSVKVYLAMKQQGIVLKTQYNVEGMVQELCSNLKK